VLGMTGTDTDIITLSAAMVGFYNYIAVLHQVRMPQKGQAHQLQEYGAWLRV
jgi:hypothetical protein